MAVEMLDVFPGIRDIKDAQLGEMVENCWKKAVERGGWEVEDLEKMPFTLLISDIDLSLARHTRNVTECSLALGKVLDEAYQDVFRVDFDLLTAGALLHDVGKALEYRFKDGKYVVSESGKLLRHPISGCALAAECGLPEAAQHIIAAHSWEGDKGHRSVEAYIVHHADFVNFHPLKDR